MFNRKKPRQNSRTEGGKASYKRGHAAEFLCRMILRLKGYRILAARYKTHQGEIDIIAARGRVLAFIEVKARPDMAQAAEAVLPQQQARLSRAAALFTARTRGCSHYAQRFDVMLVLPWRLPRHIENAFSVEAR